MYVVRERRPIVTYLLIIINILVFLLTYLFGRERVIALLGVVPRYLIEDGDVLSLVTSMFVHADFLHILFNMWALFPIYLGGTSSWCLERPATSSYTS